MENTYTHKNNTPEFINSQMDKKGLNKLLSQMYLEYGGAKTAELANTLKNLGYKYATKSGVTISIADLSVPASKKDLLKDLLMFYSSSEDKLVTLSEYTERMKEEQKGIYYACGKDISQLKRLPQAELLLSKDYEILFFTDDVDEFAVKMLEKYNDKEFINIASDKLDLESEEEKEAIEKQKEENKELLSKMTEILSGNVKNVVVSSRLVSHPVCLSAEGSITLEMEKVMNQVQGVDEATKIKAEKILEINPNHPIFNSLIKLYNNDSEKLERFTKLLYNQALLIAGFTLEDPAGFSNEICSLMAEITE